MKSGKALLVAAAMLLATGGARAQAPIRMLSGFPPGGAVDTLSRVFAERLTEATGRPVVVETRAGAAGQIAAAALKAAAPDGSTLMVMPDSMITLYPHTVRKPVYDTLNDFVAVAHTGSYDNGFAITASVPANDFRQWVGWAKLDEKNATYGSSGTGTTLHFLGMMIAQATGVPLIHAPYRGVGPAITDLVAGQIPAVVLPLGTLLAQSRAGKVRILAQSGTRRSSVAPDIPTFKEMGYSGLEVTGWFGLFAPAGIRPELVARYNEWVVQATRTSGVRERMRTLDLEIREMNPAEMAAMVKADFDRWGPIVRASGFSADSQ